ncbi:cytochrome-c peroxidase [Sulfurimonas sp. HSL-1716]|uniref:cytochrome-c peroxidase n=1 Tax=Hydrocurvibacter sulfurireducens TaxID=3131937 RepID=UPI0031F935AB
MKFAVLSAVTAVALTATPLMKEAKNAGLVPIPANKAQLYKLIDNPKNPITKAKVKLGKELFFDTRLSKSGLISCNTCHNLATGGVDGVSAAIGHKWTANPHHLNSPTVYNAVFFSSQFWDGRSPDVENQAQGPIQAAPEMAATPEHIVAVVTSMPRYVKEFKKAYGDKKITFELVADTIATFERTLVTPAPYDKFLRGNDKALNATQKRGLKTFIDKGCTSCHTGIALGGEMQPFGVAAPYKYAHIGDFAGNKNGLVKVPTLRNITETAPYFHNGAVATLKEAIQEMGRIQLGIKISDKEAADIQAFFGSLEGKKPTIIYPQLPAVTASTPKPDAN